MSAITFLHAGLHKTASTSFQETCAKNRKLLENRGFNYPSLYEKNDGTKTSNHSAALFNTFSNTPFKYHLNAGKSLSSIKSNILAYKRSLLKALLNKENLILSGEDVSDLNPEEQESLAVYLSSFSNALKTFAIIRSPYSLHCSAFAGMINNGRNLDPTSFLSQINKIKRLQNSFRQRGNMQGIKFFPFATAVKSSQGPNKFLLEAMGAKSLEKLVELEENKGISNEQTRSQMKINSTHPRLIESTINKNWRRSPKTDGRKFLLYKNELKMIMPELSAENEWFEKNLGKDFCDTSFETID